MVTGFNAFQAFSLQGQTSVVSGGGNGIGKAAALGLARPGAHVVIMDIELLAAQFPASEIVKRGASKSRKWRPMGQTFTPPIAPMAYFLKQLLQID